MDRGGQERRGACSAPGPTTLSNTSNDEPITPDASVECLATQDQMAYYTQVDGCVVAVDTNASTVKWIRQTAPSAAKTSTHGPWICVDDHRVIVGGIGLAAYDPETGTRMTTYIEPTTETASVSASLWQPIVLSSGDIVATRGNEAVCIDQTGDERWRYELDPSPPEQFNDFPADASGTETFCHPAADDNTVYLLVRNIVAYVPEPSVEGEIHALSHDGEHRWTASRTGHVKAPWGSNTSGIAVGDSAIYLAQYALTGTPIGHGVSRFERPLEILCGSVINREVI